MSAGSRRPGRGAGAKRSAPKRRPRARSDLNSHRWDLGAPPDWVFEGDDAPIDPLSEAPLGRRRALSYPAVFAAVNLIAKSVAKLPLHVYRRGERDYRERADDHPLERLIQRPTPYMTRVTLLQTLSAHVLLRGNAYAYVRRGADGRPQELTPLDPDMVTPLRIDGEKLYELSTVRGRTLLRADEVLHVLGLGADGVAGYSVLRLARESLGLGLAMRQYAAKFLASGGGKRAVLEHPGAFKDASKVRRLREQWAELYGGINNAHRVVVLEEGMKLNAFGVSPDDAQLLESRQFEVREVASWFGVPPHKIGDTTRSAYASLEQENASFLSDCLDFWLVAFELAFGASLLSESERATHYCEFDRNALLRANFADRANGYKVLRELGVMSANDVRRRENLSPLPADQGDVYLVPLNMQSAAELAERQRLVVERGQSAADRDYKRRTVSSFLAGPDTGPIVYNMIDIEALIRDVGLPVLEGAAAPPLPVTLGAAPDASAEAAAGPEPESQTAGTSDADVAASQAGAAGQDAGLNGAQIQALREMLASVTAREQSPEAVRAMIQVSFPWMDPELIDAMVAAAARFVPDPVAALVGAPGSPAATAADERSAPQLAHLAVHRAHVEVAREVIERMRRRVRADAERVARRGPAALRAWMERRLERDHRRVIAAALAGPLDALRHLRSAAQPELATTLADRLVAELRNTAAAALAAMESHDGTHT